MAHTGGQTKGRQATERPVWAVPLAGFGLILVAALLLWLRFGPAIFLDSLSAVWSCF